MQKCLGKSRFDELLTAYIEKPQGKPTLVPESNKRSAMNNAKTDFMEENQMKLRNLERRQMVWLILLILYIGVIYSRSMKPAVQSSQESGAVLEAAIELLNHAGLQSSWLTEHIVRKTAHFVEYAGMGVLLFGNLASLKAKSEKWLAGMLAVLAVPLVDETIQLFSTGRAAMVQDVWLDISGAVFGLAIAGIGAALWRRIRRKH